MIWWYGDMMMWWYDHVVIWWYIDIWSLMCNALDFVVANLAWFVMVYVKFDINICSCWNNETPMNSIVSAWFLLYNDMRIWKHDDMVIWWCGDMMIYWYMELDVKTLAWFVMVLKTNPKPYLEPFKNHSKSYQNQWFWVWCLQWLEFLILAPCQEPFKNLPKSYQNQWFWACCLQCWYIDMLIYGIIWIWWYNGSMILWYDGLVIWWFGASISFN